MKFGDNNPKKTRLSIPALLLRLTLMGIIPAVLLGFFAYAGGWLTPGKLTQSTVVDTFEDLDGIYLGFRRNHAKGLCFRGYFESNGQGVELSRAALFPAGKVPVVGRFSFAGGFPFVPDSTDKVRALAVRFELPNGEEWRTAMIDIPVFPVGDVEAFHERMIAFAPDPVTGKPDPVQVQAFMASHPGAQKALPFILSRPVSSGFENDTFYALNAFHFIDTDGNVTPVRWSFVPEQPFGPASNVKYDTADHNFLFERLIRAVQSTPQRWRLVVTIGEPGDPTNDASIPWPDGRRQVDLGTMVVELVESEDVSPTRDINFDPLILPDGIAASDDPLLSARSATYSVSFTRREGEPKEPSAVSPAETEHP